MKLVKDEISTEVKENKIFVTRKIVEEYDAEEYLRMSDNLDARINQIQQQIEQVKKFNPDNQVEQMNKQIEEIEKIKKQVHPAVEFAEKIRKNEIEQAKKEREKAEKKNKK